MTGDKSRRGKTQAKSSDPPQKVSSARIAARLAEIDDPVITYFVEMLIDRVAEVALAKRRGEAASAGLTVQ